MAVNKWDKSEYERQMSCVKKAANAYSEWIDTGLGNVNVTRLMSWVERKNITDLLREGLNGYQKHTVRLHDLHKTMKQYMEDYEDMLAKSQGQMENVEEIESAYGSFDDILVEIGLATGAALAASKAYEFAQSGKTFSADYNDLSEFMNNSWAYSLADFWHGVSKIGDLKLYEQTIRTATMGDINPYVEDLLRSGLKSMVESIPASKPVSITNINWDAIGKKLGIENMEEIMQPVSNLLIDMSKGNLSNEKAKSVGNVLTVAATALKLVGGDKVSPLVAVLEGFAEAAGDVETLGKATDYLGTVIANYFNGYADQIAYLDTLKASFLEMGYWEDSPVMQQIDELKRLYDDTVTASVEKSQEVFFDTLDGGIQKVVGEQIPLLGDVAKGLKIIGKTSSFYGDERVTAAGELMGCMQFDNMLTQTYEHYSNLVESGAATIEEIEKADQLFAMLKSLKIKEYSAMQKISDFHDKEWHKLATEKLDELNAL